MRVALVYDRINKIGGAEKILEAFHTMYPEADWYTSVWEPRQAPFSERWRVSTSWLNRIPYLRKNHEHIPFLMPFVFEAFNFTDYDLVISIGSAEAKGVITRTETLHINYCLTPTRYLWSHYEEYIGTLPWPAQEIAGIMQKWDRAASSRPDEIIAISNHVKNRIQKYYNREATVIYPPVRTKRVRNISSQNVEPRNQYYLVVSRLVSYKNIDMVVGAFNQNGRKLIVVGSGKEYAKLRALAKSNSTFVGEVSDGELGRYYHGARAFIQANEEDFGIAMVEALAHGVPVIAYEKGGASEIVTPSTGVLYNERSVDSLNQAIAAFEGNRYSADTCRRQAAKFDESIWRKNIESKIGEVWQQHRLTRNLK